MSYRPIKVSRREKLHWLSTRKVDGPYSLARATNREKMMVDIDEKEKGRCSKCFRCTWEKEDLNKNCGMIQPSGYRCEGVFLEPLGIIND